MNLRGILTGPDRWFFKPALVSSIIVALIELVCQLPGLVSFLLIPLSLLGYEIAGIVILTIAVYCFIKKRPRRAASVLSMLLVPLVLWFPINRAADVIHIWLTVNFGIGEIGIYSGSSDSNFAVYDWSVGLAGANTFLIHDVSDEIALPMAQHKQPPSSEDGFGEECAGNVHRLLKHYYVCSF